MYIVTGATGHIGNNVVRYLISLNKPVRVLARKLDSSLENLPIEIEIGDVFNPIFLDKFINPSDIVIHCAGFIDLLNREKYQSFRTNYQGTKRIADLCLRKGNRLVYISSVDAIPKKKRGLVLEPLQINPKKMKTYYAKSKALATDYILELIHLGLNAVILYPSAVIGVNDFKPSAAGKEILSVVKRQVVFSLRGGYNFIDVCDVAKAIVIASDSNIIDHIILSNTDKTIFQLYQAIEKATKTKKIIIPIPSFIARLAVLFTSKYSQMMISAIQDNYHYSNEKMKKYLLPTLTPFDKTINETIVWLLAHQKE
ncbi:MAG: NAD-dependent epimerase/dehydratase family protein [Acholeplasmataceae bacterium]|nr:NAD-dependent epimerase/dehydratase family protein [Acholeplasmataceae bacterium]